ncbi:tetratricopeptide repeat protein [Geodermatophilus sp. SYSU D00742]
MTAARPLTSPPRHLWVVADGPEVATLDTAGLDLPPALAVVSAHRRLRGPYTAAGEVVRTLSRAVLASTPELAARHDVELLAVAPELSPTLRCLRAPLSSVTAPVNRTRFHPGGRTTRLAHGLVEFLVEYVQLHGRPRSVVVTDVDDAEPTDLEWLAVLLRRTDPALLRVAVHTRGTDLPAPLGTALRRWAHRVDRPAGPPTGTVAGDPATLAAAHVAGDCTSRDPARRAAYEAADPAVRAALHDARADQLAALGQRSLALGALALHRERGSDPTGAGARALLDAIEHCVLEGFYDAVVELAPRCLAVLDWRTRPTDCWLVVAKVTTACTALGRPAEAEAWYDLACAATTDPSVHLQSAYGRAMLFTRFYTDTRRDHRRAKSWVNTAISMSALLPDEQRRTFNLTFNENGLALVEMHLGDLDEALRLVEAGLARLDAAGEDERHTQHRSVLAYNRAQLLAATGALEAALAEYDAVIAADPHHSEYHFERASVLRRLGRLDEAMRDLETAIRESPPYPEPHHNRGDLAAALGDVPTALAEFSYVLELDPAFLDARVDRALLRLQTGDVDGAAEDVAAGLEVAPDSARLECLRGLVAMEREDAVTARTALDRALALDPTLAEALANRAVLRFEDGDVDGSLADLTAALEVAEDPAVRGNRALALLEAGRPAEALADCERALAHPDADTGSLSELLARATAALDEGGLTAAA